MLRNNPGLAAIAVLTLALGIGANTAIFSVVNAVLFRSLPVPNEARLVVAQETEPAVTGRAGGYGVSYLNFSDWQSRSRSFESMAVVQSGEFTLTGVAEPVRVQAAIVSSRIFDVLGIPPALGRGFQPADDIRGAAQGFNSIVLGHECWRARFNADRGVIGRAITLDGQVYSVIGVMPAGVFPLKKEPIDFWITSAHGGDPLQPGTMNGSRGYRAYAAVLGRLKPDVSVAQAQAELTAIAGALERQYPENNTGKGVRVTQLRELFAGPARSLLWLLLGIVAAVLLIACANVANLLLARASSRSREIAIRSVLGASRWRITRQLLAESGLLALVGGALGLVLSLWGIELLLAVMPADLPHIAGLQPDWRVLLFTAGVSVATGALCGLTPAIVASRADLSTAIKDGGRAASGHRAGNRLRGALVVAQVAVSMILLAGAGLLLKSFYRLQQVNPGFNSASVLTAKVVLPEKQYDKPEAVRAFYASLLERIKALPGVTAASMAQSTPLTENDNGTNFDIVGRPFPKGRQPEARLRFIGTEYFATLGIRLRNGRDFSAHDGPGAAPVVIVNEAFVRRHFPGEDPIGKKLRLGWGGDDPKEIVGVAGDVRHRGLDDQPRPEMYVPHAQFATMDMTLLARTQAKPESLTSALASAVRGLDAELPLTEVKTLDQYRADTVALPRFNTALLLVFAAVGLILTAIGLYGVIAYSVAQRTNEIGIRMALGAQGRDVIRMIIAQGLRLTLFGVAAGLIGALALTRLIQTLLFDVSATDPLTFAAVTLLLGAVAGFACWLPARRAANVDPMVALRRD
jgi:putative ABC transport system permease protein